MIEAPLNFRTYTCDVCGTVAPWGPTWRYYGSLKELEDYGLAGIFIACSDKCRQSNSPAIMRKILKYRKG